LHIKIKKKEQMNLTNEFEPIRQWAEERDIFTEGTIDGQLKKLIEETKEVSDALEKGNETEFIDAIGDTIISAVNLAKIKGYDAEHCINVAFKEIKDRKGKMINGTFVKNI
jgi:NTP pyrophosphatase (non-canonical NTP hydrolase)